MSCFARLGFLDLNLKLQAVKALFYNQHAQSLGKDAYSVCLGANLFQHSRIKTILSTAK